MVLGGITVCTHGWPPNTSCPTCSGVRPGVQRPAVPRTVTNEGPCPACSRILPKGTAVFPRVVDGQVVNFVCEVDAHKTLPVTDGNRSSS